MTLKPLLLTACSPNNPSPNYNSTSSTASTNAILKLDTKGHTSIINDIIVTKSSSPEILETWFSQQQKIVLIAKRRIQKFMLFRVKNQFLIFTKLQQIKF